jgi:hypothetical protein
MKFWTWHFASSICSWTVSTYSLKCNNLLYNNIRNVRIMKCNNPWWVGHVNWNGETSDKEQQTLWPLVRKRTIPTDRPPLVGEIQCQLSHGQCSGSPTVNLCFLDQCRYLSFKYLSIYAHEAEWTLFWTHCYAENVVAPGLEPRTSGLAATNSDH